MYTGNTSAESANEKTTLQRAGATDANGPLQPSVRELLTPPTSSPGGLSESSPANKRVRDADDDDAEEGARPKKKKTQVFRSKSLKSKKKSPKSSGSRSRALEKELQELLSDTLGCKPLQGRGIDREVARINHNCEQPQKQKAITQSTELRSEQNSPRHVLKALVPDGTSEVNPEQPARKKAPCQRGAIHCSAKPQKKESPAHNNLFCQEDDFKVSRLQSKHKAKKSAEPRVASTETGQRTVWGRHTGEGKTSCERPGKKKYLERGAAKRSSDKTRTENLTRTENKQSQRKPRQITEYTEYHNHATDIINTYKLSRSAFKKKTQANIEDPGRRRFEESFMIAWELLEKDVEKTSFREAKNSPRLEDLRKRGLFSLLLSHFTGDDLLDLLAKDDLLQLLTEDRLKEFFQRSNLESLGKFPKAPEQVHNMPSSTSPSPASFINGLELKVEVSQKARERLEMEKTPKNQREHESRNVDQVVFGGLKFPAWFPAAYPPEVIGVKTADANTITVPILHVCEKCFAYTVDVRASLAHKMFCSQNEVPGVLTYDHQGRGIWKVKKVDGAAHDSKVGSFSRICD
jgi:hypothetical protein